MIDFTVFEKKKKLKLYRRITNIVLKKKKKNAVAIWPVTGQGVKNTK